MLQDFILAFCSCVQRRKKIFCPLKKLCAVLTELIIPFLPLIIFFINLKIHVLVHTIQQQKGQFFAGENTFWAPEQFFVNFLIIAKYALVFTRAIKNM